jgi:outer membrane protein assembly factor BamB
MVYSRPLRRAPIAALLLAGLAGLAGLACRSRAAVPPNVFPLGTAWTATLDQSIEGPLATDGVRLFVATADGAVSALDLASGTVAWRIPARHGVLGWGHGLVVLREEDGTVWGMEAETGHARWKVESGIAGAIPPVVAQDGVLVAGEGLALLDPATGAARWSVPSPPAIKGVPALEGARVLAGEADGALRARDAASGALVWAFPTGGLVAAPVVDDRERVLVGPTDRRFLAIDLRSGEQKWRWKVAADVQGRAAILEDNVVFASHEDVLYALNRGNGNMAWRAALPSRPLGGPLLAGRAVLVACFENEVVGLDARTGRKLGTLKTPAEIRTPPVMAGERLFVGLRDHTVVALQLAGPPVEEPAAAPESPAPSPSPIP